MKIYFDFERIEYPHRLKFIVMRLKEHVALWWEYVQQERLNRNKGKIHTWNNMF
jgi:hypothetical protein